MWGGFLTKSQWHFVTLLTFSLENMFGFKISTLLDDLGLGRIITTGQVS